MINKNKVEEDLRNEEFSSNEIHKYKAAYVRLNINVSQEIGELTETFLNKGYKLFVDFEIGVELLNCSKVIFF